jgi:hypothetical protein
MNEKIIQDFVAGSGVNSREISNEEILERTRCEVIERVDCIYHVIANAFFGRASAPKKGDAS